MSFWRNISPRGAVKDFLEHWSNPQPYRWQVLGISVAATFAMLMLFIPKSERIPPARPTVTYISTWEAGRTEAEIIASNIANQKRKDEAAAEAAALDERRKEFFRALGRATGIDVDEMERKIVADKAAEDAAKAKAESASQANPPAGE